MGSSHHTPAAAALPTLVRLERRNLLVGAGWGLLSGVLAVIFWWWPAVITTVFGHVISIVAVGLGIGAAGVFVRRSRLWHVVADELTADASGSQSSPLWILGVCGPSAELRSGVTDIRIIAQARKNPAAIVPIRAVSGQLADGQAVLVHGQPHMELPAPGQQLYIRVFRPRGPYLLRHAVTGEIFAADRWMWSAW